MTHNLSGVLIRQCNDCHMTCACLKHAMHSAAQFGHFDATLQSVVLVTALPFFAAVTGFAAATCFIETQLLFATCDICMHGSTALTL